MNTQDLQRKHWMDTLEQVVVNGDLEKISGVLQQFSFSKDDISQVLCEAVRHKRIDAVKLLMPLCDVSYNNSDALRWAAHNSDYDMVALLLPHSDPKAQQSEALQWASIYNNQQIFDLLYEVSDPQQAFKEMMATDLDEEHMLLIKQRMSADIKQELLQHVTMGQRVGAIKKM